MKPSQLIKVAYYNGCRTSKDYLEWLKTDWQPTKVTHNIKDKR